MTSGDDSLDDARRFISSVKWRFAKMMAHYNPHWYVVERDSAGPEFTAFVALRPLRAHPQVQGRSLPLRGDR
jgi:hypothetical protein